MRWTRPTQHTTAIPFPSWEPPQEFIPRGTNLPAPNITPADHRELHQTAYFSLSRRAVGGGGRAALASWLVGTTKGEKGPSGLHSGTSVPGWSSHSPSILTIKMTPLPPSPTPTHSTLFDQIENLLWAKG